MKKKKTKKKIKITKKVSRSVTRRIIKKAGYPLEEEEEVEQENQPHENKKLEKRTSEGIFENREGERVAEEEEKIAEVALEQPKPMHTQEILKNIDRSSDGLDKMKHKSFTNIGKRNLSFDGERRTISNVKKDIEDNTLNMADISGNSIQKIPSESMTTLGREIQRRHFPTESHQGPSLPEVGFNRVLAESMREAKDAFVEQPVEQVIIPITQNNAGNICWLFFSWFGFLKVINRD